MAKTATTAFAVGLFAAGVASASVNRRTPVVEAVQKCLPSVVNIGTEKLVKVRYSDPERRFRGDLFDQFFSDFFGPPSTPGYRVAHSLGSGVIIDPRGFILTNFHVIERASRIRVTLSDETNYDATFLAGDEVNDLALLKIEPKEPLKAITFAKADDLMLGEPVIVLGNPFGLAQTVTVGVLSAKNREASYGGQVLFKDILQTDAAVNPGNSGGPLLNIDGELIGINVAIYREAQNIGFAIPVSRTRPLLAKWLSPEGVERMWLGFQPTQTEFGLEVPEGTSIQGLKAGDLVVAVGDQELGDLFDFNQALLAYKIGENVPLRIKRALAEETVEVPMVAVVKPSGEELAAKRLGLTFMPKEPTAPAAAGESFSKGLVISKVADGGAAAQAGLKPGLLLTRIGDKDVNSMEDVATALSSVKAGDPLTLTLVVLEEAGPFLMAQNTAVQVKAQ